MWVRMVKTPEDLRMIGYMFLNLYDKCKDVGVGREIPPNDIIRIMDCAKHLIITPEDITRVGEKLIELMVWSKKLDFYIFPEIWIKRKPILEKQYWIIFICSVHSFPQVIC